MAVNLKAPVNVEDPQVLKNYLDTISDYVGSIANTVTIINNNLNNEGFFSLAFDANFKAFADKVRVLETEIKDLVSKNLETNLLQGQFLDAQGNVIGGPGYQYVWDSEQQKYVLLDAEGNEIGIQKTLAFIAEQFGTNYEQNEAASWYGLTVGAGGIITGFTVGALDKDIDSYGTEDSVFGILANNFYIGRSPNTQEELNYLNDKNLDFLTLYDNNGTALPAFSVEWLPDAQAYNVYFNGTVTFSNVKGDLTENEQLALLDYNLSDTMGEVEDLKAIADHEIVIFYNTNVNAQTGMQYGDYFIDTDSWNGTNYQVYRYEPYDNPTWVSKGYSGQAKKLSDDYRARIEAGTAQATADGKITTYHNTDANRIYYQGEEGDLYIATDNNKQYYWDNGWKYIDATESINAGVTTINGGKITTLSIDSDKIAANAITLNKIPVQELTDSDVWETPIASGLVQSKSILVPPQSKATAFISIRSFGLFNENDGVSYWTFSANSGSTRLAMGNSGGQITAVPNMAVWTYFNSLSIPVSVLLTGGFTSNAQISYTGVQMMGITHIFRR